MIIGINQPHYLPWLQYYSRIQYVDLHIYLDHVQFEKNSLVNRNYVVNPRSNTKALLTVPVKTGGRFGDLAISNLEIAEGSNWRLKHVKTILSSLLKGSPNKHLLNTITNIIEQSPMNSRLVDLIYKIDRTIIEHMQITTEIQKSSNLSLTSCKSDLILEICSMFGATTYLSGPYGRSYLDLKRFKDRQIQVEFTDEVLNSNQQSVSLSQQASAICDL